MNSLIRDLVNDVSTVALTFRQLLEPIEGRDVPIFPPTYPAPEKGQHRFDTPYTVNRGPNDTLICDIDSVQSQANRMEAVFSDELADVVPQHAVEANGYQFRLTELPHRVADAVIRATALAPSIREWMVAFENGDPMPLAKIAPTALVYGAWDSRDTKVHIPRAIRSEIRAFDVSIMTRSAQFSGTFSRERLGLDDNQWKKGADVGFAPTPSVNAHGGVLVQGDIVHTATISASLLRRYQTKDEPDLLPRYLLCLAIGGLLLSIRDYSLRSGCWLVPAGAAQWTRVFADGRKEEMSLDGDDSLGELRSTAKEWAGIAGVTLGGEPQVHLYDPKVGATMFASSGGKK